jgi:hypothetical protein
VEREERRVSDVCTNKFVSSVYTPYNYASAVYVHDLALHRLLLRTLCLPKHVSRQLAVLCLHRVGRV